MKEGIRLIEDKFKGEIPDLKGKIVESVEVEGAENKIRVKFTDGGVLSLITFFEAVKTPKYPLATNIMRFASAPGAWVSDKEN